MRTPALPQNEVQRLAALRSYAVLDAPAEPSIDDLSTIAAQICGTPIALVSLVDADRQWFLSRHGLDATETGRDVSFCGHAILQADEVLVVPDALLDERFADNPLVVGELGVRFYAGAPLVGQGGMALGTLCVIGHEPRHLAPNQLEALSALSRQVVAQLELRRQNAHLRELAEVLQRSERELKSLGSRMFHDLRAPLRHLVAFSALLEDEFPAELPGESGAYLGFITTAASNMDRLVVALAEYSRLATGAADEVPVATGDCARVAVGAVAQRVGETNATIDVGDLPDGAADRALLSLLFQKLLENALTFVGDGPPEVELTCVEESGEMVFGVQDNGIGIEAQYFDDVFAPFKRLHSGGGYEGAGMGLATARRIVEQHGGRIWVESTVGHGSHFRFTLSGVRVPSAHVGAA